MTIEKTVWITGPKEEEAGALSSMAEEDLTSKNQVAVQSGLMTNSKGMDLWKKKKKQQWKIKAKKDTKKKRHDEALRTVLH
uniref:Uncharacterized protein n=1 Tax=Sphaerodactylus townsendi TaxID=933632 RepID=A0ACB8GDB1_9SAUR